MSMAMRTATTMMSMTGMPEADAGYRAAMADRQAWDLAFDPATGFRLTQEQARGQQPAPVGPVAQLLLAARGPAAVGREGRSTSLADAAAWPELSDERRARLTTLLAGFRVAEDAVAEHIKPFGEAANNSLVAWVLYLQRRDEQRHAVMFDRIAEEVLKLPGDTPDERLDAAREHTPPGVLELFEERLPAMADELAAGRARVDAGIGLYHMILEGIVLLSGQRALLADLEDGALPGVLEGVERVEKDERWHIGFGLRCLIDAKPSAELIDEVLATAEDAAEAWGDVVPKEIRDAVVPMCRRRFAIAKLLDVARSCGLAQLDPLRAEHPQVVEHAAARLAQAQAIDERRVAPAREAVGQERRAPRRALDRVRGAHGRDAAPAARRARRAARAPRPGDRRRGSPAAPAPTRSARARPWPHPPRARASRRGRADPRAAPPARRARRGRGPRRGSSAPPLKTVRFESAPPIR